MRSCFNIRATATEGIDSIRVGIKGSWFVNYELISWSHEPKIHKVSIFHELFFPKYVNFEIIGEGHICQSTCLELKEWDWLMKEKKLSQMFWLVKCRYTLTLKFIKTLHVHFMNVTMALSLHSYQEN